MAGTMLTRQQVATAVVAALTTTALPNGATATANRTLRLQDDQLPAVAVYVLSRSDDSISIQNNRIRYRATDAVTCAIHVLATTDAGWATTADAIENAVKARITGDATMRATFERIGNMRTSVTAGKEEEYRRVIVAVDVDLHHEGYYSEPETDETAELVHITVDAADPDGADAEAEVDLDP